MNVFPSTEQSDCIVTSGDPVDLPIDSDSVGLVFLHLPDYIDFERHYQPTFREYWLWVTELIDEAERVLEPGGRLVVIARHMERQGQYPLDLYPLLLSPLIDSGFLVGPVYTWAAQVATHRFGQPEKSRPSAGAASMTSPTSSSWRIVVASKGFRARQPSVLERIEQDLPNVSSVTDEAMEFATCDVWVVSPPPARQGDLPDQVVRVLCNMFTFVDDVVVFPLTGTASGPLVCLEALRRVVAVEPDPEIFDEIAATLAAETTGPDPEGRGG